MPIDRLAHGSAGHGVADRVLRQRHAEVGVVEGLTEGDTVITTRLIDPLENALLEVDLK